MHEQGIVIVGAGLGGMSAAETLRSQGFTGRLTVIGDEPHLPYTKPPLSKQLLRGEVDASEVTLRPAAWYAEKDIDLLLGTKVLEVDTDRHRLGLTDGGSIAYGSLLLTTGGRARTLDVPGERLDGVHTLRTVDDALAIKERLRPGVPVVVAGGGFIGAEVAASARLLGCEVTILEIAAVPLSRVLGPEVGRIYTELHRSHGVKVLCGVGVAEICGQDAVSHVVGTDGSRHEAAVVVVGVGIAPNDVVATGGELRLNNGVVVDELCRTSAPDVFAAGDIAFHPNPILGRSFRIEQWQNAQHQAQAAARSMLGQDKPFAEVPWFWSDQYDVNLQMAGIPSADAEPVFRGDIETNEFSVFYLREGVVEGVVGLNRVLDVRAGRRLVARRAPVPAEELSDESVALASIVAGFATT